MGPWHENERALEITIFELFDWLVENKEFLSGSENVRVYLLAVRYEQPCFQLGRLGEGSLKEIVFNVANICCRCCNKAVLVRNNPVHIFGKKSIKEPELLNVLQSLTGKEIKYDDGLPRKLC